MTFLLLRYHTFWQRYHIYNAEDSAFDNPYLYEHHMTRSTFHQDKINELQKP